MQSHLGTARPRRPLARGVFCAAALACAAAAAQPPAPGRAGDGNADRAMLQLRVVGGLAGVNQYTHLEAPFWSRDLARLSGGRYGADIVPFDRAGVPGGQMLRLLSQGVVPFGTVLLSSLTVPYPQYTAVDLPGLNPNMATLRASLAAFRPYLEKALREEQGIEPLAIYVYPAQVLFCTRPLAGLDDLRGRRVRVSSASQGDFFAALGAKPLVVPFAQIVRHMEAGSSDCAVTGTMSGNTIGLDKLTTTLYPLPVNWGLAIFGANSAAWQALPPDLRTLLHAELPKLESAIWRSAEQETAQGIACNVGADSCTTGRRGHMKLAPVSAQDEERSKAVFAAEVLPHWLRRCGARCADIWNETIGRARGVAAPRLP